MAFRVTPSTTFEHINKKAQTSVGYSQTEVFALPLESNKQQETYAGMRTHYTLYKCSMDTIIPIGIHRYFDFDSNVKSCEVFCLSNAKRQ